MKAAVCRAIGAPLVIEDLTLAAPGPGQIEVDVAACAICHSDIAYADGAWGGTPPVVLGHEAAGTVRSLGPGVEGISPGQPVLVTLIRSCGTCPACATGQPTSCDHAWTPPPSPLSDDQGPVVQGMSTAAFAERVVVDQSQVVGLPEGLDLSVACLISCGVITGFGAVTNTAKVEPGQSVAVIGAGGVGLNAVQGAVLAGATPVIAIDIADARLETARSFGATHGLRGDDSDHGAALRDLTDGRGVDFAFVTVGAAAVFQATPDLLAPGGALVMVGMPPTGAAVSYDAANIAAMNQRLLGSRMGQCDPARDIPALVALWQNGKLELERLVSNRYPLTGINDAIAEARSGRVFRNVIVFDTPT